MTALKITLIVIVLGLLCWGGYNIDNLVFLQEQNQVLLTKLNAKVDSVLLYERPINKSDSSVKDGKKFNETSSKMSSIDQPVKGKLNNKEDKPSLQKEEHFKKNVIPEKSKVVQQDKYTDREFMEKVRQIHTFSDLKRFEETKMTARMKELLYRIKNNFSRYKSISNKQFINSKELEYLLHKL